MAAKQAPSKVEKTPKHRRNNRPGTKAHQKNRPATKAHQEKPRIHHTRNHCRRNHLATKSQPKKPSEHSLPTQCTTKAEKPLTIKKIVEPISKRKLAWEMTEEEGKTTIDAQHVLEFFNNLNTKQQRRELEKTKQVDPAKTWVFQTNE
jgi:hypothetical protein